jgi:hypothetical protein
MKCLIYLFIEFYNIAADCNGGCLSATDVTYVAAVMVMKVLPCPTPKDNNAYYWASVIPMGLCTSLLPRRATFIQLISCRQEQEFDPREE